MKVEFDKKAHALYIYTQGEIGKGDIKETKEIIPDVLMLDYDVDGIILGIEILDVEKIDAI